MYIGNYVRLNANALSDITYINTKLWRVHSNQHEDVATDSSRNFGLRPSRPQLSNSRYVSARRQESLDHARGTA